MPGVAQLRVDARRLAELARRDGPARRGGQAERDAPARRGRRTAPRRSARASRRPPARRRPRRRRVEHDDRQAALARAPGHEQADDAAADDGDVDLAAAIRSIKRCLPTPALSGSGDDGRRLRCRPLSPRWAPVRPSLEAMDRRERLRSARLYFIADARPGGRPLADVLGARAGGRRRPVPAARQARLRRRAAGRRRGRPRAVRPRRRAVHRSTTGRTWPPRPAPTACTSARTTRSVAHARAVVGPDALVGLSTHSPAQIDAVPAEADLIGVGPVYATPTKAGRGARRPGARRATPPRTRACRGSPSAAWTPRRRAAAVGPRRPPRSPSCARSPTRPTRRPPRARCARCWTRPRRRGPDRPGMRA